MEFLAYVMTLPESLMLEYDEEVDKLEAEEHMSYAAHRVQRAERLALEKGLQQGLQQETMLLIRQLKHRFNEIPVPYLLQIQQASHDSLLIWAEKLLDAKSIEEVFL